MNMKKKILTAALVAGMGCLTILPLTTEAEATAALQEPVFVEVLPAEPEPADVTEEPVLEEVEAEASQPDCREGFAAYITSVNHTVTEKDALVMADSILEAAEDYDVDENLLLAIAHTESTYYSDAVSSADCKGLMQTGDALAEEAGYSPDALFDPEVSIAVGADYISDQLDTFDQDVELALTAYNQGPGAVYSGTYDTAYAELTLNRVQNIENFLSAGGYVQE